MTVSAVSELADAQLSISGFGYWEEQGRLDAALALIRACWRSRGFGDFWHHMLVAEGAVDVAVEPTVSLWDLAAPQVIVEEAGGRFTDLGGVATPAGGDALSTNGLLHEAALAIIGRSS
jgi:histidinol-phosphatase